LCVGWRQSACAGNRAVFCQLLLGLFDLFGNLLGVYIPLMLVSATLPGLIGSGSIRFSRFDGTASRLPGIETASQGVDFGESCISELLRHTGAGFFLGSGSVDDREPVFGPRRIKLELVRFDADGARDFEFARIPCLLGSGIEDRNGFPGLQTVFEVICADPNRLASPLP
jgi:hypothetical protein